MRVLSLHYRAAALSFCFVALGVVVVRAAGARGIDFRTAVEDSGKVAMAAMAILVASASLFVVAGGEKTLSRVLVWGDANQGRAAACAVAAALSVVIGAAVGLLASAHFLTHYRAAGWAALANGAVFAVGLVTAAAAFRPAEGLAARVIRDRRLSFTRVLAAASFLVALALAGVSEKVVPGSLVITAPTLVAQAVALLLVRRLPAAAEFVVTRAFMLGCLAFVYLRLFAVPAAEFQGDRSERAQSDIVRSKVALELWRQKGG